MFSPKMQSIRITKMSYNRRTDQYYAYGSLYPTTTDTAAAAEPRLEWGSPEADRPMDWDWEGMGEGNGKRGRTGWREKGGLGGIRWVRGWRGPGPSPW